MIALAVAEQEVPRLEPAERAFRWEEPQERMDAERLAAPREVGEAAERVGADVVEVIPTAIGSADVTALVAERTVREVMTGIALRRAG